MIPVIRHHPRYLCGGLALLVAVVTTLVAGAAEERSAPQRPVLEPVSLHAFGRSLGLEPSWIKRGEKLRLKSEWSDLVFTAPSRELELTGVRVLLGDPAQAARRTLEISAIDRDRLLMPILAPQTLPSMAPLRRIALDPGHGGRDTGTRNNALELLEKHLTLDVVNRLQPLLKGRGYRVIQTRTTDIYVDLAERPARAARERADVFLSIHFNAGPAHVQGIETYILTPQYQRSTGSDSIDPGDNIAVAGNRFDEWSAHLGYTMHRQLIRDLQRFDRGLKHARFEVLRELQCPGILIEGGFVSHKDEARLVGGSGYRQRLAEAIARGVDAFDATLKRLETRRSAGE